MPLPYLTHFSVKGMTLSEFDHLANLVTRAVDTRRKDAKTRDGRIRHVSDCRDTLPLPKHSRQSRKNAIGICWNWSGVIWVDSNQSPTELRRTSLHEIAHMYAPDSHGPNFRRIYGIAEAQYHRELGMSEKNILAYIEALVDQYRHYRGSTITGGVTTPQEFQKRCDKETLSIYKKSLRS